MANYTQDMADREGAHELGEANGDPTAHNNQKQLNARMLISRKAEYMRTNDPSEGLDNVDDGVEDSDIAGGYSPVYTPTDDTLKALMETQPAQKVVETAPAKHKIKVNGQEMELTTEELIARAQKVEAADQYLADAKRQAESSRHQVEAPVAPSVEDEPDHSEDLKELARKLQIGSEDEAAEALAKLVAGSRQKQAPSLDLDAVAAKTIDTIEFKQSAKWFQETYPDIFDDPNLKMLAFQKDDELRRSNPDLSYRNRYQKIGDELRKWVGRSPDTDKKRQQKAETLKVLPQASVRSQQPIEEEEDDTPASVIAEMAKARGQLRI